MHAQVIEVSCHVILYAFVLFEVVCGYFTLKNVIHQQVTRFQLQQFLNNESDGDATTVRPAYVSDSSHEHAL